MPRKKSGLFDQSKYIQDYSKEHYKRIEFKVRKDNIKVINKLDSVENKSAYIINLIEKDLNK